MYNKQELLHYLRSNAWKEKAKQRLKLDNYKCRECGGSKHLQIHHKNYDNLYNEDVENDLITMCYDCHKKITLINRRKRMVVTDIS